MTEAQEQDQDQRSRGAPAEAEDSRPEPERKETGAAAKKNAPGGVRSWIARHKLLTALIVGVVLAAGVGVFLWWLNARHYETTDDAFIDARPSDISAQVSAAIVDVLVTDNVLVKAGQPLVRLDDRDYRDALAQAEAQIGEAGAAIGQAEAQTAAQQSAVEQASLQVTQAQAALTYSQDQNQRAQDLLKKGAGTLQQAQQANADLIQKRAALDAAAGGAHSGQAPACDFRGPAALRAGAAGCRRGAEGRGRG